MRHLPIVALECFIRATRDSGYKSLGSAIAEFIDNSIDAGAKSIDLNIQPAGLGPESDLMLRVSDNGCGMSPQLLRTALQFGGSSRFGSRMSRGRYGMGLPNGALSQARRLEVQTWTKSSEVWASYLDVDEIAAGSIATVPKPKVVELSSRPKSESGTIVLLRKCDRFRVRDIADLESSLAADLGRIFRKFIQRGTLLRINGRRIRSVDPLFTLPGATLTGAKAYGPPLQFDLRVPRSSKFRGSGTVSVSFSELPIDKWHVFPNEKKNKLGISKGAGVSIMRADREIDLGWYFMGTKRKENYDDWWRCEISFSPDLDELFGVTHSKQKIHPTEWLSSFLTPEIERIARELNSRVRQKFSNIKSRTPSNRSMKRFEVRDHLLEPPRVKSLKTICVQKKKDFLLFRKPTDGVGGLKFLLTHKPEDHNLFFSATLRKGLLSLNINEAHPFYSAAFQHLNNVGNPNTNEAAHHLLLLLVSFARAEFSQRTAGQREIMGRLREAWSDTVAAFLS